MTSTSFRKYFSILILFSALAFFNSCSVHYFSPQRIDVYGFDTSKQTKGIIEPYFNMFNLNLAIAHSFSKHIYFGVGAQGDFKYLPKNYQPDTASNYSSGSVNALAGYFRKTKSGNLIDISGGWGYEKMYFERSKSPDGWGYYGYSKTYRAQYQVPYFQFSYCFKGESSDTYFTIRTSGILRAEEKEVFTVTEGILYRVYIPYALLFSPSIQFNFRNAKAFPFFITANISTKQGDGSVLFAPPFQAGIKFIIH